MAIDLRNAVVVVTGASSGIGRAASLAFARHGCRLLLAARNQAALENAARECRDAGAAAALAVPTDVARQSDVAALAERALQTFGGIDVWVNDAGVLALGRFDETPLGEIDRVVAVNLMGTIHGCHAALKVFRRQGRGVLINISSMDATVGVPLAAAYAASKWGVRGLSNSLRLEVRDQKGIQVCDVLPPSVDTPLFQHAANHAGKAVKPIPPVYAPERVADLIVDVARRPRPEAFVGASRIMEIAGAVAPGMAEPMMARAVRRQHFQDRPSGPSSGNLFTPRADAIHGGWGGGGNGTRSGWILAAGAAVAVPLGILAWRRLADGGAAIRSGRSP